MARPALLSALPLLLAAAPAPAKGPVLTPANAAAVKKAITTPGAKAVLVNIWASWCGPCRDEFPDVLKLRRDLGSQGVRVVLVSFDFEDARADAVKFLAGMGVDFPSFIRTGKDEDFANGLAKEWTGVLPATLVYDGQGTLRDLREGKQSYETFRGMVEKVLKDGSARPAS
jgi:thiol-disulfide isomerase/thioredoxin